LLKFTQLYVVFFLSIYIFSPIQVFAAEYSGTVKLVDKGKPAKTKEYEDVVVYFVPADSINNFISIETKEIIMKKKTFSPRVLPITVGSSVDFPNFDPILHNAFSTSRNNKFDLGLIGQGDSSQYLFDKPGLVRVYCNVHHSMVAYVLIFDSPFYTMLSTNGEFNLENLPPVSGELFVWHPRAKVVKQKLDLSIANEQMEFNLDLNKRRIPKHKNKTGSSYRAKREKRY
jgi:plastocyanin